jgi:hypothetical protein
VLQKILRTLIRLVSLQPADPRVIAIKRALSPNSIRKMDGNPVRIAVQGVEDPLFFGLFASLVTDLRKVMPITVDLIQTRSINAAIGTGLLPSIARSWIFSRLFNAQWARANSDLIETIAYRSQQPFLGLGSSKEHQIAQQAWEKMNGLQIYETLNINGIQVGDLIIDSYLRFRPSPVFNVEDPFVLTIIRQAVRDIALSQNYFSNKKPKLYISSYSTYIEHGIAVRVAVNLGIPVRVYGNLLTFGKQLNVNDTYHTTDTSQYFAEFKALTDSKSALAAAEAQLKTRLSGGIDSATSYMKVSAYARTGEAVPDVNGAVIIFLHDFYDSPHVYNDLIFPDFWRWICFTIQTLTQAGIPFWIKPHPNQIALSSIALDKLKLTYPDARYISHKISNVELVDAGMLCGITAYGTVAHELAYMGIPSITCARHPHASFSFCWTAKTVPEYKSMLLNPNLLPLSRDEMRRQALAFYYIHNLSGATEQLGLRAAYVQLWKTCHSNNFTPNETVERLTQLRTLPGWQLHLIELQKDIETHEN